MRCRIVNKGNRYWCEEYRATSGPSGFPYLAWCKITHVTYQSESEAENELKQHMTPEIVVKEG